MTSKLDNEIKKMHIQFRYNNTSEQEMFNLLDLMRNTSSVLRAAIGGILENILKESELLTKPNADFTHISNNINYLVEECKKIIYRIDEINQTNNTNYLAEVDLNHRVVELYQYAGLWDYDKVKITKDLYQEPNPLKIITDGTKLSAVMFDIVFNSMEAMPDGGNLEFKTDLINANKKYVESKTGLNTGKYALLQITDTGVGISSSDIEKIFQPFFSTKGQAGLGLALAYKRIKDLGANIYIDSKIDKGTTCSIYFPVKDTYSKDI